jgi:AcrR family transcriptional regulator
MALRGSNDTKGDERRSRILTAALEVFSKSSFSKATTEEIARRARVSKRDIYATFPDKHAMLATAIETILENSEANLRRAISDSQKIPSPVATTLEIIGLVLVSEILSPLEGFVCRMAFAESAENPLIGKAYFDSWYTRRVRIVAETLSRHSAKENKRTRQLFDKNQASRHFLALVTHSPQLTVSFGATEMWTSKSVQAHVKNAVQCFLRAYPYFT